MCFFLRTLKKTSLEAFVPKATWLLAVGEHNCGVSCCQSLPSVIIWWSMSFYLYSILSAKNEHCFFQRGFEILFVQGIDYWASCWLCSCSGAVVVHHDFLLEERVSFHSVRCPRTSTLVCGLIIEGLMSHSWPAVSIFTNFWRLKSCLWVWLIWIWDSFHQTWVYLTLKCSTDKTISQFLEIYCHLWFSRRRALDS